MGYADQKFYAKYTYVALPAAGFGTATAGSTTGANRSAVASLPPFIRRCKVTGAKLHCTTIPNASATALVAQLMNGTSTVATFTLTTATAGQFITGSVTDANSTFTAAAQGTFNVTGTATASADVLGTYNVILECQELPS